MNDWNEMSALVVPCHKQGQQEGCTKREEVLLVVAVEELNLPQDKEQK